MKNRFISFFSLASLRAILILLLVFGTPSFPHLAKTKLDQKMDRKMPNAALSLRSASLFQGSWKLTQIPH